MAVRKFDGDDAGYLDWIAANPQGFVVNTRRYDDPSYFVLHRASCGTISSDKVRAGAWTERNYVKLCSTEIGPLLDAAQELGCKDDDFSKACSRCHPRG